MVSGPYPQKFGTYPQEVGQQLDLKGNYILHTTDYDILHVSLNVGVTDVTVNKLPAGVIDQNRIYTKLAINLDQAPGAGKTVSVSLTNGTDTFTVNIADTASSGYCDSCEMLWDAATDDMTITYSQTAGGASTKALVVIEYQYDDTP